MDDYKPMVSVVMPIYNASSFLSDTLDSLVGQTLHDYEVIMVDDGSTDSTVDIAHQYVNKDSRFRLIKQENQGAAGARNRGLGEVRGQCVIFLDADDLFDASMLLDMSNAVLNENVDVCICGSDTFDSNSGKTINSSNSLVDVAEGKHDSAELLGHIFQTFRGAPWDKMFRSSFLKENHYQFQNLKKSNDSFFVYANLLKTGSVYILKKKYVHYRCSSGVSIQDGIGSNNSCVLEAAQALCYLPVPKAAYYSFETWSFWAYLRAFELSAASSEMAAKEIFDQYRSHYKHSLGLDSIKASNLTTSQAQLRFWCEERLSFSAMYRIYCMRDEKREEYESRAGRVFKLIHMFILALFKQ